MRYTIRRISLSSALRLGCALGGLVALPPTLCLAALGVQAIVRLDRIFAGVAPITIRFLGRELASIDLLAALRLRQAAETAGALAENSTATFLLLAGLLALAAVLFALTSTILAGAGYNLLAAHGLGLSIDLAEQAECKQTTEENTGDTI